MINEVILPKQGLQMTEGCITKWHKNKGDFLKKETLYLIWKLIKLF